METETYTIVNGWICEVANHHTCGTGPGGYYGAHEPGCGLIPLVRVGEVLDSE